MNMINEDIDQVEGSCHMKKRWTIFRRKEKHKEIKEHDESSILFNTLDWDMGDLSLNGSLNEVPEFIEKEKGPSGGKLMQIPDLANSQ